MSTASEESNRCMLRARDAMDRRYALPLDIPALAEIAHVSEYERLEAAGVEITRSRPPTSTGPTSASAIHSATTSGSCSRQR